MNPQEQENNHPDPEGVLPVRFISVGVGAPQTIDSET